MDDNKSYLKLDTNSLTPIAIIIAGGLIALAVYFGTVNNNQPQVQGEKTTTTNTVQNSSPTANNTNTNTNTGSNTNSEVSTSIDDDAVLGNKDTAQVAIVEFSDFDCPYCKRHYTDTYGQLKKNFVDTGKVIYVFRDLPLPSHSHAQKKAEAAECAGEQGGSGKYFEFHDGIFEGSISNDTGLIVLAEKLNLNKSEFESCLQNGDMTNEVKSDTNSASQAGVRGTPGFVVGKLDSSGNVTGTVISGAQSYTTFQTTINKYLN